MFRNNFLEVHVISVVTEAGLTAQTNGHRREKTCLRGFRQSEFHQSLQLQRLARKLKFHL